MRRAAGIFLIFVSSVSAFAKPASQAEKKLYRDLVFKVREQAEFKVPMPNGNDMHFSYSLKLDSPKFPEPVSFEYEFYENGPKFIRYFYEKVFAKDGSYIEVGGEQIPLTCIHVSGQDNRFSGKSGPLVPDYILKITFVANDWTCQGPIKPGWPKTGGKKDAWETYVHYEVTDPTIMLPIEAGLRYRWSEFDAILVK